MITHRTIGLTRMVLLTQAVILTVFFWVSFLVIQEVYAHDVMGNVDNYTVYNICIIVGLYIQDLSVSQISLATFTGSLTSALRRSMRQTFYSMGILVLYLVATKDATISRVFFMTVTCMTYVVNIAVNKTVAPRIAKWAFRGSKSSRGLLVGVPTKQEKLVDWIQNKKFLGFESVAVISASDPGLERLGVRWLEPELPLPGIVRELGITHVVLFSALESGLSEIRRWVNECEELGIRLLVQLDVERAFSHSVVTVEDDGFQFLALRDEPLENPFNQALKRIFDLCFALPVVVLILPCTTLIVWIIQRLYSPGPLFYRQERAGRQNRTFEIVKYRTMHVRNDDPSRQASVGDSRIYKGGYFLRKFSIDELPQFFNVLLGEMSVVGPRPHMPEHNTHFAEVMRNYHVRTYVKPGITGLAQVRGLRGEIHDEEDIIKRAEADIYYIENWSLYSDIRVVYRTIKAVVMPPKSAY